MAITIFCTFLPLEEKKEELDLLVSKWRNSIMGRVVENYWMYYDFVEEE